MKYFYLAICILVVSVSSGFCSDKELPLKWEPANSVRESEYVDLKNFGKARIRLNPIIDSRKNKNEIGRNIEKDSPHLYITNDSVAKWTTDLSLNRLNT